MIAFTHPAKKIDQVDSKNKDMGLILHDTTFRSGSQ